MSSQSDHIRDLTKELLDDIELGRTTGERLLLKTARLARLIGSEEIKKWLEYEMRGYNSHDELSRKYITNTGRWIDKTENKAYYGPLSQ